MGLEYHDLVHLVDPHFTVDRFKPESGDEDEVTILAFRVGSFEAAEDLASFIDKGVVPGVLDAQPSPGCDVDGKFRVFVELKREKETPVNVLKLIKDIGNVVPVEKGWTFEVYGSFKRLELSAENIADAFLVIENGRLKPRPPYKREN